MKLYQQGDVLVFATKTVPTGARKLNHLTLAYGEATGHHHTVTKGEAELYEHDGTLFLRAAEEVKVTHQEHGTITLPKGNYKIGRVQEYDHFAEEAREVMD